MQENLNSVELAQRADEAKKCTWIGFAVNGILSALKIVAGLVGRSGAMVADGIHSLSDFVTDVIVIVFIGVSARGIDKYYRYGHGKFETFATMLISVALMVVAVMLFFDSGSRIVSSFSGEQIESPTKIALVMAFVSILAKEILYRYTKKVGVSIKSMALMANAWHHRSDAFSSVATLIGIAGAMFLSPQWRILDPIAAMLVSVFIGGVAWKLGVPAVKELLEVSLSDSQNAEIGEIISQVDGIVTYHHLRTRKNGHLYVIDFHIKVAPELSVVEAHKIASDAECRLRTHLGSAIVNIHIEPYNGEQIASNGSCKD